MKAGNLDRRVTIQRSHYVGPPGYPGSTIDWSDYATVWAKVTQKSGREFFESGGKQSDRQIIFTVRWLDVSVLDRLLFEDSEFEIVEVRELGRRSGIEIHTVG